MSGNTCGCTTESCGCCEGSRKLTPMPTANRRGLDALRYRVGTHGAFLQTMKARLADLSVEAPGADGQTLETFLPLSGLTARDGGDPAIALLDGWASVTDVLTFYQERIANEAYLRTATERRSVLELAKLVGYKLRPGVAASVYLAYTLDDNQTDPVEIPAGARSQSIPGPDELPQSFETSETLEARAAWNNLQVRLTKPQNITYANVLATDSLYLAGTATNLKAGDQLLLQFDDQAEQAAVRTVAQVEAEHADNYSLIRLQPVPPLLLAIVPALVQAIQALSALSPSTHPQAEPRIAALQKLLSNIYLGVTALPDWLKQLLVSQGIALPSKADGALVATAVSIPVDPEVKAIIDAFVAEIGNIAKQLHGAASGAEATDPSLFVEGLLLGPNAQAANSLALARSLSRSFAKGSDAHPQLLVNFAPQIKDSYYAAWANANVNAAAAHLKAVYALRINAPLFGANIAKRATFSGNPLKQDPPSSWEEWPTVAGDEQSDALFLDQAYDAVLPDSYAMVQIQESSGPTRMLRAVTATQTTQRSAYGISGKTTQLSLNQDWWKGASDSMSTLRGTLVYAQSEALSLAEQPMPASIPAQDAVGDDGKAEIELAGLYRELKSGRWVIFSGERDDIPGVSGVKSSELLMVSALKHGYDAALPGDQTHTTLTLATPPAYRYKRDTLTIYANVVKATHGETRQETLGSGDGAQALQTFTLKQPPVTFVSAANPTGVESTLKIYVNDVEWREADTLALAGPKERRFVSKTDDNANTSVVFGNGKEGARLPTGVENVKAVYRSGIGKGGNVRAEQISLLQTRALGVKSVVNPLRASGGADKESRDQARDNAPLAVMALDRLVSVQDYADFTRTFAGIGKAAARRLSDGRRELVHITIAGADDIPIDRDSDLYRNLLAALYQLGDEGLPVQVEMRELVALMLSANIKLAAGYRWEPVVTEIRAALLNEFGFQKRALGQAAQLCEIVSLIQGVAGVEYVDVDAFGGLPEKRLDLCLQAPRLLTLDELALAAKVIVTPALGAYLLRPGDIPDVAAFRQVFVDDGYEGGYAVAQYLLGRFSKGLADKLNDEAAAQSQPLCLQAALVAELNAILQGVSLYDANLFYSVPLDAETLALVVSQPQGMALVRLNRLLLDQAFSGQITPMGPVPPPGPARRVEAGVAEFYAGVVRPARLAIFTAAVPDTITLNRIS